MAPKKRTAAKAAVAKPDAEAAPAAKGKVKSKATGFAFPALEDVPGPENTVEKTDEADDAEKTVDAGTKEAIPSRGARYVFESQFHTLPEAVRKEYEAEKLSKVPGKQTRMNRIILKATQGKVEGYTGSLRTNEAEWRQILSKVEARYTDDRAEGYCFTELLALLKTEQAIADGIKRGDVVEEKEKQRTKGHSGLICLYILGHSLFELLVTYYLLESHP